mmetsp:Transcript_23691/g.59846  ORF Transcript_23691/g.59846 Transcript_23691/m.59846 type:complete len:128 (+) Transcript_23691:550-933(+)
MIVMLPLGITTIMAIGITTNSLHTALDGSRIAIKGATGAIPIRMIEGVGTIIGDRCESAAGEGATMRGTTADGAMMEAGETEEVGGTRTTTTDRIKSVAARATTKMTTGNGDADRNRKIFVLISFLK